jgi:hypothetical protein
MRGLCPIVKNPGPEDQVSGTVMKPPCGSVEEGFPLRSSEPPNFESYF